VISKSFASEYGRCELVYDNRMNARWRDGRWKGARRGMGDRGEKGRKILPNEMIECPDAGPDFRLGGGRKGRTRSALAALKIKRSPIEYMRGKTEDSCR